MPEEQSEDRLSDEDVLFSIPEQQLQVQGPGSTWRDAASSRTDGRKEARRSLAYILRAALEYGRVGGLVDLLDRVAALRDHRPFNALLLLLQLPAATRLLPAHRWEAEFGRVIRADQQPLVALQPGGPVMFLFDVSQTDPGPHARPLPERLRNPYGMSDWPGATSAHAALVEQCKHDGVRVLQANLGNPFAGHISPTAAAVTQTVTTNRRTGAFAHVPIRYETAINSSYSPTERLATLAHELGHLYCGHLGPLPDRRNPAETAVGDRSSLDHPTRELEAESVARVVFQVLAPTHELPDHLSQYFDVEPDLEGLSLENVLVAAGWVLDMAHGRAPQRTRGRRKPGESERSPR